MKTNLTVEVFGSTCDAALIASQLCERGESVTWYMNTPRWPSKPQKLHSKTFRSLVGWLSEKSRRVDFLLTAPEIAGWKIGEGSYAYNFPFLGSELSRWVDSQLIFLELKQICKEMGVRMVECERFPAPDWTDNKLRILACDTAPLVDWPRALMNADHRSFKIESCETIYPSDPLALNVGRIYTFGSTFGLLEPQSNSKSCLSLYDQNQEGISRCLRALQNPLSNAPSFLRALSMQNMGAKRKFHSYGFGRSSIDAPGIVMLMSSLGTLHPATGLDLNLQLTSCSDFIHFYENTRNKSMEFNTHAFSAEWNKKAENRFLKNFGSSQRWIQGLRQSRFCKQTVATATLLPQFLREALKSPL